MKKNIAVVVTYNRCELLKKAIDALKGQTVPLDTILVINNGSTDGTAEWLSEQAGITVITQENLGGSGGFWRGIKEAYSRGADYIWCMDDDVHPYPDCLEQQLKVMPKEGGIVAPQRLLDGKSIVYGGECLHFNFTNPFKAMKHNVALEDIELCNDFMEVEAIAFEGPLISRNVIEKIGLPEKDLFIFWDDTEYSYRARKGGFRVRYAKKAHMFKEKLAQGGQSKKVARSWKYPYMLRNEVFFIGKYGNTPFKQFRQLGVFLRFLVGITIHLLKNDGKYNLKELQILCRSFKDGAIGNIGKY